MELDLRGPELSGAEMRDFLALPDRVHGRDPRFARSSPETLRRRLASAEPGSRGLWLAFRGGRPVARLGASLAHGMTGAPSPAGTIGFFEALPDPAAARALLDAACRWLSERGAPVAFGPMDGDTWHRYRFNLGPHERPPFLLEPVNPDHYPELWTAAGFEVAARYLSKRVPRMDAALPAFAGARRKAEAAGYRFRPLDRARREEELALLHALSCRVFPVNPYYTPLDYGAFGEIYRPLLALLDPAHVWFCEDGAGTPAAFLFATPDWFAAWRATRGLGGPLASLLFLLNRRTDTLDIKSMGVLPEHRGRALGAALIHAAFEAGLRSGLSAAHLCLMHEDNLSTGYDAGQGELLRRYALYRRELPGAGA